MRDNDIRMGKVLEALEALKEHKQDADQKFSLITDNLIKINQTLEKVVPEIDKLAAIRQRVLGGFLALSFTASLLWILWTDLVSKFKVD